MKLRPVFGSAYDRYGRVHFGAFYSWKAPTIFMPDPGRSNCFASFQRVFLWALVMGPYSGAGGVRSMGPCLVCGIPGVYGGYIRIPNQGSMPRAHGLDDGSFMRSLSMFLHKGFDSELVSWPARRHSVIAGVPAYCSQRHKLPGAWCL